MLFNSIDFLVFFPLVVLLYFVIPFKARNLFLLIASYFFYMCWTPKYAILIAISTLITYITGMLISKSKTTKGAKAWVAVSFASNLSILVFYKYFDFILNNLNAVLSRVGFTAIESPFSVLLPVGISFYTFQALSYTMDVYRKEIPPEKNLIQYALFVSFFPQLVAGPIERSKNLLSQMHEKHTFNYNRMKHGLLVMLWGYFLKLVISDRAAILVNTVFNNFEIYEGFEIILAAVLFAIQIYCDFGGYSCIAIGAAEVMGFRLMENFNTPYFSESVTEFWRRWHISLSTWFRDYLYIPLGGNRKGTFRKYVNLMIVFLVSGLWHGASWNFVVWGGLNGLYQVIEGMTKKSRDKLSEKLHIDREKFSSKLFRMFTTFCLIDFAWIFFRADGARNALKMIRRIFLEFNPWIFFSDRMFQLGLDVKDFSVLMFSLLILIAVGICKYNGVHITKLLEKQGKIFRWLVYLGAVFFVLIYGIYGPGYDASQFIYFQF